MTPEYIESLDVEREYNKDVIDGLRREIAKLTAATARALSAATPSDYIESLDVEREYNRDVIDGLRREVAQLKAAVSREPPPAAPDLTGEVEKLRRQYRAIDTRLGEIASTAQPLVVNTPPVTIVNPPPEKVEIVPVVKEWVLKPTKRTGVFMAEVVALADGEPAWRFTIDRHSNDFPKQITATRV